MTLCLLSLSFDKIWPNIWKWNAKAQKHKCALLKVYKKVTQFSFTPTKDILVFSFWFQFIQWIEHLCMNQLQNRYYSCFDRSPDTPRQSLIIFLEEQLSCSRHRITNFPNSESPIFTMKFLFWFFHDSANTFWGTFEI